MLAQSVINGITIAPLIPFNIKRQMVQKALQTGLLTLKIFSSALFSLLSREKISQLNNLIKNKEILPLIFPKADIHYRYSDGFFINHNINDANMSDKRDNNSMLRVGSRIPHVWLNLDDTNGIISTLDINSYALQQTTLCIITTNEKIYSLLQSIVNSDDRKLKLFKIMYIRSKGSNVPHECIQHKVQRPCYISHSKHENYKDIVDTYIDLSEGNGNFHRSENNVVVVDVSGNWSKMQERNTLVILRPDDFIYDISHFSSNYSLNDLKGYLDNIIDKVID